jgi:hypothetical protein
VSDSLYEEEEELEDEGEDGGSSSYLDSSSGPPPPETNNNLLRLSPGGSPVAPTPADKLTSPQDLHHQADSSTERDPNDSEGKKILGTQTEDSSTERDPNDSEG